MSITLRPHGTRGRYTQGCRCGLCRKALRDYHQAWRDRKRAAGLTSSGKPPVVRQKRQKLDVVARKSLSLARHGTVERYRQDCTCRSCTRAYSLYLRITKDFPSAKDPVKHLTSIYEPGFARLMRDILKPDDELTAAIKERIRKRVQKRLSCDFHGTRSGPSTTAAKEISAMPYDQIKILMQPGIPSIAQTRRRFHTIDY